MARVLFEGAQVFQRSAVAYDCVGAKLTLECGADNVSDFTIIDEDNNFAKFTIRAQPRGEHQRTLVVTGDACYEFPPLLKKILLAREDPRHLKDDSLLGIERRDMFSPMEFQARIDVPQQHDGMRERRRDKGREEPLRCGVRQFSNGEVESPSIQKIECFESTLIIVSNRHCPVSLWHVQLDARVAPARAKSRRCSRYASERCVRSACKARIRSRIVDRPFELLANIRTQRDEPIITMEGALDSFDGVSGKQRRSVVH